MDGLDILIVGGGPLASRRAAKLLDAGARVRVVALHITPQLDALCAHPGLSILYYSNSKDGGLTWSKNRAVSPPFNHSLGYPVQRKMGDYIGMISLEDAACIAYAATFNGEQDIFFLRVEQPAITAVWKTGDIVSVSWKAVAGRNYCLQYKESLSRPWSSDVTVGSVLAESDQVTMEDKSTAGTAQRFYQVVEQP